MNDLALKDVLTIGSDEAKREIVVRELTPALLRKLLLNTSLLGVPSTEEESARIQIDAWLFEECRLSDLVQFTNLSIDEIEALPPSQLKVIKKRVKELNPDFFGALERMAKARSSR